MDYQTITFCKLIENVIHPNKENNLMDNVDWAYMIRLAKEHNLLPILMEEAVKHPLYVARPEYKKEMNEALASVASQTKRTISFLKLYQSFIDAELHPIVMKGLICRELYGKFCDHRPSGDEDLWVLPAEFWKAKDILTANGYMSEFESVTCAQLEQIQEITFTHPEEKLCIELHLNPMGRETDARSHMSDYFKGVFDKSREVEIKGVWIRTLSHQEHLLYLIFHAFRHFTGGGVGIRQMLDILLYQEQYGDEIDLIQLHERLKMFRCDAFWTDLIHLGNTYFGFKLPILQEPNCPQELFLDMIQCGTFGNKTKAERAASAATKLAVGNYLKKKKSNSIKMIWKALFPSKALLLNQFPYLEEKPWLVPVEWAKRWGRFIKRGRSNNGNLAIESVKISQRRMKLLKKYDLV